MRGVVLLLQKRHEEAARPSGGRSNCGRAMSRRNFIWPRSRERREITQQLRASIKALTVAAPGIPSGYLGQAEAQMMLRNPAEAFEVLQAWKAVPESGSMPYHVIANIYTAQKEPAKAIQELQAANSKFPSDTATLTYLGDAYIASQDTQKAMESYRLAVKADARNAVATNNLAWLLMEGARDNAALSEALTLAETAVKQEPAYVDALDTLGRIYYRLADYPKSVSALSTARKLAPERMDIAAQLGLAYAKVGSKAQALTELRAALASKAQIPNRPEVERVAKELGAAR